jgi:SAM-dependent methyltransferase
MGLAPIDFLNERKKYVTECYEKIAPIRDRWIDSNRYYYDYITKVLRFIVEPQSSVLQLKSETGYFLNAVNPKRGVGIDPSTKMVEIAKTKFPHLQFEAQDIEDFRLSDTFDYILLTGALSDVVDVQKTLLNLKHVANSRSRVVITIYNRLWQPVLSLATRLRLKIPQPTQNWLSLDDIENLLRITGYETIKHFNVMLLPKKIPVISFLFNNIISKLPLFKHLCFSHILVAKKIVSRQNYSDYSVSVIVPCKNEFGNVRDAAARIPIMGKHTEIIFCDDQSEDGTRDEILRVMELFPEKDIKLVHGPGICKAKNVWSGFDSAKGDILMILDADLTVIPEELPYFFQTIVEGAGDFINGSRLIYPTQENAMKFFNVLGNKFFSLFFSYIMGQKIKDTLCGTKVLWREDYFRLKKYIGTWGKIDLWGDYDLLFGATKTNLKIVDLPVHYFERTYGQTKMKKVILNGLRMLNISLAALFKLKFV